MMLPTCSDQTHRHASPGSSLTLDACRYVTGTEWVTGSSDGGLQVGGGSGVNTKPSNASNAWPWLVNLLVILLFTWCKQT
jgi:hypothetical protein